MENNIQKLLKERYYLPSEDSWEQLAERVSAIYPPNLQCNRRINTTMSQ